jgi:predicted GNAT family acetyltransferase
VGNAKTRQDEMISDIKLNTLPTSNDLEKIEKWLIEESDKLNAGFYCNWNIIEKAFRNKQLITLGINNDPVGFIVWSKGEIDVDIDIMEIKPEIRFKGIGNEFFNKFSDYIKQQGFLVINIVCSPPESEKFWKKMGFIKYPDRGYTESDLIYYKPLIEVQSISFNSTTENVVELWNLEPHQIRDIHPKWVWNIEMVDNKLILPIIQPCNYNWNLRWSKNGVIVKEDKVKYFSTEINPIDYSPFLYIKELKE